MKKGLCIAGIVVGVIMIVIGLAGASLDANFNGSYPDSATFGADFYTYIYGATHDAASNVASLGYFMMTAMKAAAGLLGRFIAAFGAAVVCFFGYKFAEIRESEPAKEEEKPAEAEAAAVTEVAEDAAEAEVAEVVENVETAEAEVAEVAENVETAETEAAEVAETVNEAVEETVEEAEAADKEI